MPDPAPNPELLHSLGRLVRGLSALFWGLPAALIVCVGTASAGWFSIYGVVPPLATTGLLAFGLWQLDTFQKQERPWHNALDRAKFFALINLGLSPFVFWWNHEPAILLFDTSIRVLALSAWFFLFSLNTVLLRLGAMLPDETLRHETRQFTSLNHTLLLVLLLVLALQVSLARVPHLPQQISPILELWDRGVPWLLILLGLLPLAMTMALIWKTKEVILESVFGAKN
jgi:magnesium-transporting ATPase (P-type)